MKLQQKVDLTVELHPSEETGYGQKWWILKRALKITCLDSGHRLKALPLQALSS